MTELWQYIVLGAVQGITEWLPISSDGHLVLFHRWLGVPNNLAFDVFLHLGSLLVILIYFRHDIMRLALALGRRSEVEDRRLIVRLIIATIVTVAVALVLNPYVEQWQTITMSAIFFIVSGIFVALPYMVRRRQRALNAPRAAWLGLWQGLAVLPGLSRSGSMLGWGLVLGLKKDEAFRFTFLAGIPAIAGAAILELPYLQIKAVYWAGFITTIVVGYLSLMLLELVLKRDKLWIFSLYTIILGLSLLWFGR